MAESVDSWRIELVRWIDSIRSEQAQMREVIHAHQERFDDLEDRIQFKLHIFEGEMRGQMKFIGRNVEELTLKVERLLQSKIEFWKVIIVAVITTVGSIAVALITGLLK